MVYTVVERLLPQMVDCRGIVVWGIGSRFKRIEQILKRLELPIRLCVDKSPKPMDIGYPVLSPHCAGLQPSKHFIIGGSTYCSMDIQKEAGNLCFEEQSDSIAAFPYFLCECTYNNVKIGKVSSVPETFCVDQVQSVGSFTTINLSAQVGDNHLLNTMSTGAIRVLLTRDDNIELGDRMLNDKRHFPYPEKKLVIGSDVWIGANVFINSSTCKSIGHGAIIGAGSVVTKDVPPFAVVMGIPAKVARFRFQQHEIDKLLTVKWWEWDNETIRRRGKEMIYPNAFFNKSDMWEMEERQCKPLY